eukprot:g23921.t1
MSGAGASGLVAGLDQLLRCQESYACSASEAAFECDECGSLQCAVCERELHSQPRLRDHERSRLKPGHLPYCDQCNSNKPSGGRRRACCRCLACKVNVCAECHRRGHSNRRKHPVNNYPQPEVEAGLGEDQKEHRELDRLRSQTASSFLLVDEQEQIQVKEAFNNGADGPKGEVGTSRI